MIEFPIPDDIARESIFKIHSRNLNTEEDIKLKKLVELTDGATGADIKAICTEAGMFAIRKDAEIITQDDFVEAVSKVLQKNRDRNIESRLYS